MYEYIAIFNGRVTYTPDESYTAAAALLEFSLTEKTSAHSHTVITGPQVRLNLPHENTTYEYCTSHWVCVPTRLAKA